MRRRQFLSVCAAGLLPARLASAAAAPPGYSKTSFTHGRIALDVWRGGDAQDPLVFILHDMVGLRQSCFDLGDALIKKRFSVAIPRFFGDFGGGWLGYFKACEGPSKFRCFDSWDYGPIIPWIKALAHRHRLFYVTLDQLPNRSVQTQVRCTSSEHFQSSWMGTEFTPIEWRRDPDSWEWQPNVAVRFQIRLPRERWLSS
jgi:hypothetical protein